MLQLYINIKNRRRELNMTQDELAEKVGYNGKSMISRIERGEIDLPQSKIEAFAEALHTSTLELMSEKGSNFITYPVVVGIKAGYDGEIIFEESGDSEQIPTEWIRGDSPSNFFVARVHGDSMYPMFIEGDRVLVHKTPSVDSGSVCAIRINENEITLKRVIYKQGEDWLELQPINTSYPPKRIEGLDLKDCGVIGEVKKLIRAL